MAEEPAQEKFHTIRKMLPFTTGAVVIALCYVGWIFFSRWQDRREAARQAVEQQAKSARETLEAYGGGRVKILNFTIDPPAAHRGETVEVCYGVSNAKTVKIEPKPEGDIWPSFSRCVELHATKSTNVTLTAADAAGHTETKSLPLKVE